jgi:hypothetical protein
MVVRLSALCTGRALLHRSISVLLLVLISVRDRVNPRPCAAERVRYIEKFISSGLEPITFKLVA